MKLVPGAALGLSTAVLLAACGLDTRPLPALDRDPTECAGVGLEAFVTGSPTDRRIAWLVDANSGRRIDVIWPPGTSARFVNGIEILDRAGTVRLHEGERVDGACVTGVDEQAPLLILFD